MNLKQAIWEVERVLEDEARRRDPSLPRLFDIELVAWNPESDPAIGFRLSEISASYVYNGGGIAGWSIMGCDMDGARAIFACERAVLERLVCEPPDFDDRAFWDGRVIEEVFGVPVSAGMEVHS